MKKRRANVLPLPAMVIFLLLPGVLAGQEGKSTAEQRRDTLRYGTETEIAALVKTISDENDSSLDAALIDLAKTSRSKTILTGLFAYFNNQKKAGLEDRAIQALEQRADEANETILAAASYLGSIRCARALGALKDLLQNGDTRFQGAAIRALGKAVGREDPPAGGAAASGDTSGDTSLADETAQFLLDYAQDRELAADPRRELVGALGETRSKRGAAFLEDIASNEEERAGIRIAALEALALTGEGAAVVTGAVSSNDPNVRAAAVGALYPYEGPDVEAAILEGFRDSFFRTRLAAADAAGKRRMAEAAPFLAYRARKDEAQAVREKAIRALGSIGPEGETALAALFADASASDAVRIACAEQLVTLNAETYGPRVAAEMRAAKEKKRTALYNGFMRALKKAGINEADPAPAD
ncbi:MAG: HEAT repeat domain-containing protein [Treponema sp.]|jgi:HEAT repeat protein|nr:HEAT repeat domain-containing protein [Treponema sp.]